MKPERALRLSRLREIYTNAGQYAIGVLLLKALHPIALVGILGSFAACLWAYSFNTVMDFKEGQTVEGRGKSIGVLSDADISLCRLYAWGGLVVSLVCVGFLVFRTRSVAGPAFLVLYVLLGFLYSSSYTRWKEVPGLECASNGLAHSTLFLAGYTQFHAFDALGLYYALSFFLFMAAYYLLHCLEDRQSDEEAGIRNLCSVLGFKKAVGGAFLLTVFSLVFFFFAGMSAPVLLLFVPFFAVVVFYEIALLRSRDLSIVGRIRYWGRWYGMAFFIVLLLRAVFR